MGTLGSVVEAFVSVPSLEHFHWKVSKILDQIGIWEVWLIVVLLKGVGGLMAWSVRFSWAVHVILPFVIIIFM